MTASPPFAPTSPSERALLPDALRGLALGGILLVNLQNFAGYLPWQQTGLDRVAQAFIDFFANGKWISTFAVLFGAGVWLLVTRSGRQVEAGRLLVLLGMGFVHGLLIWSGDILALYALVGMVALLLVRAPVITQVLLVLGGFALTAVQLVSFAFVPGAIRTDPSSVGYDAAFASPSYVEVLGARASNFLGNLGGSVVFFGPWLLSLFLLGVLLARVGVLVKPARFRRALVLTAIVGAFTGVPLNVAFTHLNTSDLISDQMWAVLLRLSGGLAFALAYGALAALLVTSGRERFLVPFARVGRLALSNYLLQSVVCTLVFYGYGLGQYGRWSAGACLVFGLVLYAVQVVLSGVYLRRFSRGPAEWLLRRLAYGSSAAQPGEDSKKPPR